jgi:hypothetical protein
MEQVIFIFINEELARLLWRLAAEHPYQATLWTLWVFMVGFAVYAGLQPAFKEGRRGLIALYSPILIVAGLIDVSLSPLVGLLAFHEFRFIWTISRRLDFHYPDAGWRGARAKYFGERINWVFPFHIGPARR